MNKLGTIIKREYLTRVKKRSFIIITFLGPLLFVALAMTPALIMLGSEKMEQKKSIAVIDETGWYKGKFKNNDSNTFVYLEENENIDSLKKFVFEGIYDAILYVPGTSLNIPVNAKLYSDEQLPLSLSDYIESTMEQEIEHKKLLASGIDPEIVKSVKTSVNISTIRIDSEEEDKASYAEIELIIGIILSMIIFLAIMLFSTQVLRGVIEEKSNRVVEIVISSVKPFELMMGKVIGIVLVGLTQIVTWIIMSVAIYSIVSGIILAPAATSPSGTIMTEQISQVTETTESQEIMLEISDIISSINFDVILISFLIYFILGYILYASLYAAIGAMVDNETDSSQFVSIVTFPLMIAYFVTIYSFDNPNNDLTLWLSMIPFTSPISMMIRIPSGVPYWQIGVSILILVVTFILILWIAAKIYRTGILMYGKKPTFKEIWKWLRY